jgi:hypothetical protein
MRKLILSFLIVSSAYSGNSQDKQAVILQDLEKSPAVNQYVRTTATLKSASRLFGDKDDLTSVILVIPSGSVVDVLEADSTYLRVVFEENEGYIFKRHAVISETPIASRPVIQAREEPVRPAEPQQQIPQQQSQPQQQQTSRFTYLENKYDSGIAAKLMSGKIWKEMTSEMVRDSWGKPLKINRVITSNTIKEEWIYKNSWLYFENDILYSWGPVK